MHEKAAHTYQRAQHKNAKANQKHILIEHEQKKKRQSDMCVVYRLHSFDFLCASFIFALGVFHFVYSAWLTHIKIGIGNWATADRKW